MSELHLSYIRRSLKHQLQDYLFNQSNQYLNDEDMEEELSHQIKQLFSLLVAIQTMTNILDQLQFYKYTTNCLRLSSSEYKMMYQVQYSTTSLLQSISELGGNWSHRKYYELETKPDLCTYGSVAIHWCCHLCGYLRTLKIMSMSLLMLEVT